MLITKNIKKEGGIPIREKTIQKTVIIQNVEVELYDRRLGEVIYRVHNLIKGLQKAEDIYAKSNQYQYINKSILKETKVTYIMDITDFCQKARIKGEIKL